MFLATGAHVGRIPLAPGTFGSLVGFPIIYLLSKVGWPLAALLTLVLILFSVWVAHLAEQHLKTKDPGCQRCLLDGMCEGPWSEYVAHYGADELTPIENAELVHDFLASV